MTEESGVNTDPDWQSQLVAMFEYNSGLVEKCDALRRQQEQDDLAYKKDKEQLQKKKAEAIHQHQVRLTNTHCSRQQKLSHTTIFRRFWTNWTQYGSNSS